MQIIEQDILFTGISKNLPTGEKYGIHTRKKLEEE
jgi:hypothetical protein